MRFAIWSVILAAVAVAVALLARNSTGYVVIVSAPWRVELSLNLLVFLVVAGYFAFYFLARLVASVIAIPARVRAHREERTRSRLRQALDDSLPLLINETLPAVRPARAKAAEEAGWGRAARDLWEEMKGLVRIRDLETPDVALLSPAQGYFLRENLKLRLLAARVALLARDESSFREDVKAAQSWIAKYFDPKARPTGAAMATLKQISDSPVAIGVPDINASLAAVRTARAAREKR